MGYGIKISFPRPPQLRHTITWEYVCVLLASNNQRLQSADEMEKKTSGKKFSKIWVYLARLSPFWEILENAVPFTTGSWRKFKLDFLVELKAP